MKNTAISSDPSTRLRYNKVELFGQEFEKRSKLTVKPHYNRIANNESANAMQVADVLEQGRVSAVGRELLCQGQEKIIGE